MSQNRLVYLLVLDPTCRFELLVTEIAMIDWDFFVPNVITSRKGRTS